MRKILKTRAHIQIEIETERGSNTPKQADLQFKAQAFLCWLFFSYSVCVERNKRKDMEVGQMQRQWVDYTKSLFLEGFLDGQFLQLQQLQDESNPDFVVEVVSLFFEDSEKLLNDLTRALEQPTVDFKRVDAHVHQFKGSSSSIGAQRVKNACIAFRNFCEEKNTEGCVRCVQQVKHEYYLVKSKLETLFAMEQQIMAAGGSIPMLELNF